MKLLITQFSPFCYHPLPLSPHIFLNTLLTLTQHNSATHTHSYNNRCLSVPTVNRRHHTDSHLMSRIRFPIGKRSMTSVLLNVFKTGGSLKKERILLKR